jgi:hypothetical protein
MVQSELARMETSISHLLHIKVGDIAQQALSLKNTPTGYFQVPVEDAEPMSRPTVVNAHDFGDFQTSGGGLEIKAPHPVSIENATWHSIGP